MERNERVKNLNRLRPVEQNQLVFIFIDVLHDDYCSEHRCIPIIHI